MFDLPHRRAYSPRTDEGGKSVQVHGIFAAIKGLAGAGTEQLIVYFAGHGVNIGYSERRFLKAV